MTIVYYKLYQTVYSHSCLFIIYGLNDEKYKFSNLLSDQAKIHFRGTQSPQQNSAGVSWK